MRFLRHPNKLWIPGKAKLCLLVRPPVVLRDAFLDGHNRSRYTDDGTVQYVRDHSVNVVSEEGIEVVAERREVLQRQALFRERGG